MNTESGLQIEAASNDPLVVEVRSALASWRDLSSGFVRKLDRTLLNDLVTLDYVKPEAILRSRHQENPNNARRRRQRARRALFRGLNITVPPIPSPLITVEQIAGTVLLMRARRASETARRTQVQIPVRVRRTKFFEGMREIVSAHDGRSHVIITASARGGINTILTIPEAPHRATWWRFI